MKKLYAITPNTLEASPLIEILLEIRKEVDYIQIREKRLNSCEQYALLEKILVAGIPSEQLILNDRIDLALIFKIQRVHLTEHSIPLLDAQNAFPDLLLSRSIHSIGQIKDMLSADFLQIGHVFPTQLKTYAPLGVETLKNAHQQCDHLVAVGGINQDNIREIRSYVSGVAMMSSIFEHSDPKSYVQSIRKELNQC